MEQNPYEATQSPAPRSGGRGCFWQGVSLAGFTLVLFGVTALPGPIPPEGAPFLLACLGCIAVGGVLLVVGIGGWMITSR